MAESITKQVREIVKNALTEDIGRGDLTSLASLEPDSAEAQIVAKSDGILSGSLAAMTVFEMVDSANVVEFKISDGASFQRQDVIASIRGFNQTILASERVALNFLGHLSGIATRTRQFVDQIHGSRAKILDTRKTLPGIRVLEKLAVVHGGGYNHRFGLYDMILIKDNHIASCGSISEAVARAREFLKTSDYRLQFEKEADKVLFEVEVESESQLIEAIQAKVDRLLLDNRTLEELRALVLKARQLNPAIELEASGNVTLDTVGAIAATGVDYISVGNITHSAPSADFSLSIIQCPNC